MARHADADWDLPETVVTWEQVSVAVLMDIRSELKRLNRLLSCSNFMDIPWKLDRIVKNTHKPKRRRKKTTHAK